jgi:hypothetical protein
MNVIQFPKKQIDKKQSSRIEMLVQFSREIDAVFSQYINKNFEPKDLVIIIANRLGAYFGHYMLAEQSMLKVILEQVQQKSAEEAKRRCDMEGITIKPD